MPVNDRIVPMLQFPTRYEKQGGNAMPSQRPALMSRRSYRCVGATPRVSLS
jgi:hypothetical protein